MSDLAISQPPEARRFNIGEPRPWRSHLLPLASVAYVIALALWVDQGTEPRGWLMGVVAVSVVVSGLGSHTALARAMRWGLAVVVASLGAEGESLALDACGMVGVMVCSLGAIASLSRVPWDGGLVRSGVGSPLPSVIAIAAFWSVALIARVVAPPPSLAWLMQRPTDCALAAAALSVLLLWRNVERMLRRRSLELGVVERSTAMRALLGLSFVAALLACALSASPAYASARLFVALAAVAVGTAATAPDPVRVARITRRVVVLSLVGGAVVFLGASAVLGPGWSAWEVTVGTAIVALLVGAAAPALEGPLRPSRGIWLDAFARAREEASRGDPSEAIRFVLAAIRAPGGPSSPSPELWTFSPVRVATVDAAGYLHEHDADLPDSLSAVAASEPLSTLRTEVLDALEVRRPELRPIAKWMSDRDALLATLVESDGESDGATEGVLVLRRAARVHAEPVTLEELRAFKSVADRLAAACRARATRARLLARAQDAVQRADATEKRTQRLTCERARDAGRDILATVRLARPATVGAYSAASRQALEAIERRTLIAAPIAVVAPSGVDPVPYLARAHLSGARRDAPLVVVDATSAREHDPSRWTDPLASPLALADRGMLVLLDGAALPTELQELVAGALAQRRTPWESPEPLDVQLALTGVMPTEALVAQGRLSGSLASRLGEARFDPVILPRLRDRADDLRAILTDRLAREGLRVLGRPIGIEQAAFARLVDYAFPGEDAELAVIVQRLVARCSGEVVRAPDVEALRLRGDSSARRKDPLIA